tara:strand:- start:53 stop:1480 length:1428 start_codon:yes stop_codon:yes gene_type:complete
MVFEVKNICCIGAGYVGGPSMAVIAKNCPDIQINVVDINIERIERWNDKNLKNLPIYEPGLEEIVKKCRGKNLHFSKNVNLNIANADMIFISVNTPTKTKGLGAGFASDLKWIEKSAREISKYAKGKTIIVEKSTLPVKTASTIKKILYSTSENSSDKNEKTFYILSNPEFLAEGSAIKDLDNPDRVLIGGEDEEAIKALSNLYIKWIDKEKILTTNLWSSELSKLISNAFLAQRISSINSVSAICEATGADIKEVSMAIGSDKRIGKFFLNAGPGFGGSCFKKDILNLIYICKHYGLDKVADYWEQVININSWQISRITQIIVEKLFGTVSGKRLVILGFSFKANTNDTRESPAIYICQKLMIEGGNLIIYDPKVDYSQIENDLNKKMASIEEIDHSEGEWYKSKNIYNAVQDADAVILLTEWDQFINLDWERISNSMRKPSWIFDTRYLLDPRIISSININYWRIGYGDKRGI